MKRDQREKIVIAIARDFVQYKLTVREAAKEFGYSKSTIYVYLTRLLLEADQDLYYAAAQQLQLNKSLRHVRGGEATKKLWEQKYECRNSKNVTAKDKKRYMR